MRCEDEAQGSRKDYYRNTAHKKTSHTEEISRKDAGAQKAVI